MSASGKEVGPKTYSLPLLRDCKVLGSGTFIGTVSKGLPYEIEH